MSTFDDETPAERRERHRRAYAELGEPLPAELPPRRQAEFDIDSAGDCEPQETPTEYQEFERARRAAAGQPDAAW